MTTTTTDLFTDKQAQAMLGRVANLSAEYIDIKPMDVDWSEGYGESWTYWEAVRCDDCEAIITDGSEHKHLPVDHDTRVPCIHCDKEIAPDDGGALWYHTETMEAWCDPEDPDPAESADPGEAFECPNTGTDARDMGAEGPMMNYLYPMEIRYPAAAAEKLVDLPLVVVCPEWQGDGPEGLALSGGGMDLSWEICEAFIALGYLPPVHFARLPNFAGKSLTEKNQVTIWAMAKSLEIMRHRLERDADDLNRLQSRMAEETGERIAKGEHIYG